MRATAKSKVEFAVLSDVEPVVLPEFGIRCGGVDQNMDQRVFGECLAVQVDVFESLPCGPSGGWAVADDFFDCVIGQCGPFAQFLPLVGVICEQGHCETQLSACGVDAAKYRDDDQVEELLRILMALFVKGLHKEGGEAGWVRRLACLIHKVLGQCHQSVASGIEYVLMLSRSNPHGQAKSRGVVGK